MIEQTRRNALMYKISAPTRTVYEEEEGDWAAATLTFLVEGDDICFATISGRLARHTTTLLPQEIGKIFEDKLNRAHHYFRRLVGPLPEILDTTIEAMNVHSGGKFTHVQ